MTKTQLELLNTDALELLKECKAEIIKLRRDNEFLSDHTDRLETLIDLIRIVE